jgi:hypothetical protein
MHLSRAIIFASLLVAAASELPASSRLAAHQWPETGDAEWTDLGGAIQRGSEDHPSARRFEGAGFHPVAIRVPCLPRQNDRQILGLY